MILLIYCLLVLSILAITTLLFPVTLTGLELSPLTILIGLVGGAPTGASPLNKLLYLATTKSYTPSSNGSTSLVVLLYKIFEITNVV